MALLQLYEGVGGLGILIGGKLVLPGDGSEEAEDEGETEGGGVSRWKGERRRGEVALRDEISQCEACGVEGAKVLISLRDS